MNQGVPQGVGTEEAGAAPGGSLQKEAQRGVDGPRLCGQFRAVPMDFSAGTFHPGTPNAVGCIITMCAYSSSPDLPSGAGAPGLGGQGPLTTQRTALLIPQPHHSWVYPSYTSYPSSAFPLHFPSLLCLASQTPPHAALPDCTCPQGYAFLQPITKLSVSASPWGNPLPCPQSS